MKKIISKVREDLKDFPELGEMFQRCYTNTYVSTMKEMEDGTTHVITGDIPAMWLRDSTAQVRPYLVLAKEDAKIRSLIAGLVRRQVFFILTDPYANAFNEQADGRHWTDDEPQPGDWVWERKYEIDSLCYPIQLAWLLWKHTGNRAHLDEQFREAAVRILKVFRTEQNHEELSEYRFIRKNTFFTDTLSRDGKGALVKSGIGMTWSGFRPSDDACTYGYLVPSNMFASVALGYLAEIAENVLKDDRLAEDAKKLQAEIYEGIEKYAVVETEEFGRVYAYEVDGYGQYHLMDDANVPSLLSMDYLGYQGKDCAVAENTRRMILSEANPYYYSGSQASGIGSPHTPSGYIWHIAMAMEGLTEKSRERRLEILKALGATDGGTGMMHEGFCKDDSRKYTREWFSWANALFCELAMSLSEL